MAIILTTTGTSLMTNAKSSLGKSSKEKITQEELVQYMSETPPKEASAETNSLLKIAQPTDKIVFLYTATPEGKMCAEIIKTYLTNRDWSVRMQELLIENDEFKFERKGLRHLVDILIKEITQAQSKSQQVIINATGGFKAEIAYTTMVGMIFQVPVKYIYQNFNQPITFPALPITWDTEIMLTYDHFFEWIDSEPRYYKAVEDRLKRIPEKDKISVFLLPPDSEECIYLSVAGDILWQRLRQQRQEAEEISDPPSSQVPDSDKVSSSLKSVKHHYPKYTRELAEKLATLAPVDEIIGGHFENTTFSRLKGVSEEGTIRLLWADDEKATNLTIYTTARGIVQTLRVRDRIIRPVFKDFCDRK